jgi:hypothetical protein
MSYDYDEEAAYDRWKQQMHEEVMHAMLTGEWLHHGENPPPEDDDPEPDEEADA